VSYLFGGPDASTLYGGDEAGDLYILKVDSSGVGVLSSSSGLLGNVGGSIYFGGLIYDGFTGIVDPAMPSIVTAFDNQGTIAPLPAGSQVLILGGVPPPEYPPQFVNPVLTLNDAATGIRLWSLPLPLQIEDYQGPMIFWGTNGVALREGQYGDSPAPSVDLFRLNLGT
jgi:hypothetical protein